MSTQFRAWWARIRDSIWFLPGLMTVAAILLAWGSLSAEGIFRDLMGDVNYLRFNGGAEGARGVLSTITSTLITVTALVFSITIVALQLASSQFTPRILRTFSNDRANQLVLGVFIGSFTYTLLVLRTIRSPEEDGPAFVPALAITISIFLALLSIFFLIFFIHHSVRTIRLPVILDRITTEANGTIRRLYPEELAGSLQPYEDEPLDRADLELREMETETVAADRSGYLQVVNRNELIGLAHENRLTLRLEAGTGSFILEREPLVEVWPATFADEGIKDQIRRAFVIGSERTLENDLEFGIRQIADIAIKAMSPGINAPTTAMLCIDRLADILVVLGTRRQPDPAVYDDTGRLLLIGPEFPYERSVDLAFDQLRFYGSGDPYVAVYLLQAFGRIGSLIPVYLRRPLARQSEAVLRAAREELSDPGDRARLERAADQAGEALGLLPSPDTSSRDRRPNALSARERRVAEAR